MGNHQLDFFEISHRLEHVKLMRFKIKKVQLDS